MAQEAMMSPQDWSIVERDGWVPPNNKLARLCEALGKSTAEAEVFLGVFEPSVSPYESLYREYKESIISQERRGPVGIFIVREDPEPVDYVAVQEYIDVLAKTEMTSFTLLFRYPDPRAWRSVQQLVGALMEQSSWDRARVLSKVRGFYRHPDYAEHTWTSLPMAHRYILTSAQSRITVASWLFDEDVKQKELAAGYDESQAAQRSLCIMRHERSVADRVANWVGFRSPSEPLPQLWVPVEVS
jgi:hypothetical protein